MLIFFSLLAAIIPMFFYLLLIWKMDKHEREPLFFVIIHFLWGAFGAIVLGVAGHLLLLTFTGLAGNSSPTSEIIQTTIFAPFSEEIAKGLFLLWSVNSSKFDNITDGLVYGAAIGLGFGMTENFIYFVFYSDTIFPWVFIVLVRSLFSAVMHCIATATFGAFLAMAKLSKPFAKSVLPLIGLSLAMFFHFVWNLLVSVEGASLFGFLFMIFLIAFFILIFKLSVNNEMQIIEYELNEEALLGFFPSNHVRIISSNLRFRKGWIDEKIRALYSRTAIHLAFSKMKMKRSSEEYLHQRYLNEIKGHREIIRSLLYKEN